MAYLLWVSWNFYGILGIHLYLKGQISADNIESNHWCYNEKL